MTEFPASARPFYHLRPTGQPQLTASFDLLWKGLEITTGAQREHRYDVLVAQAAEQGLSPEPMQDYLNNFRYGCPPHGGFGLGLGRLLMTLLGLDSIRDATFLFRGPNRLTPYRLSARSRTLRSFLLLSAGAVRPDEDDGSLCTPAMYTTIHHLAVRRTAGRFLLLLGLGGGEQDDGALGRCADPRDGVVAQRGDGVERSADAVRGDYLGGHLANPPGVVAQGADDRVGRLVSRRPVRRIRSARSSQACSRPRAAQTRGQ